MRWITLIILGLLTAACTTFEFSIETPSSPDEDAIATLANLMFEGTQYAQILSAQGGTPEPISPLPLIGKLSGRICYPGLTSPPMTLFFRNLASEELMEVPIDEYQDKFEVDLPAGSYYVFSWAPQYLVGGLYSEMVICGDSPACTDHNPATIAVVAGASIGDVDICDWGFTPESLPLPPGVQLLGGDLHPQPIE
jgi:hypothetical protein